ncbi:MAG TPA: ABC transporter substrate-binding protein [Xanthobacteraceae bacterium]|nr:ABC transporter substrate-binding protein [Xanthobacteraceae bacterium]
MRSTIALTLALSLAGGLTAAHAQDTTVKIATARSLASLGTYIGVEKGYFKEAGINVEVQELDSSADAMALLAQGGLQIVEGGISAGFFNALDRGLPVTIIADRTSSPIGHKILVRNDLKDKIKSIKDLKGTITTTNGAGSISLYETGKVLESVGLSIKDVEVKVMPFGQLAVAFANKAIDSALTILPWSSTLPAQDMAFELLDTDDVIKPYPIQIAGVLANTDWLKKNPDLAKKYMTAYMRGIRDFCQAYHHGANREEIIQIAMRTGVERRPEFLNKFPWAGRDVYGKVNSESLMDSQAWFRNNGYTKANLGLERLFTSEYIDHANKELGAFKLDNEASTLKSCR